MPQAAQPREPIIDRTGFRPVLGARPRPGRARLLMICYYDPSGIPTIVENIACWQQFSQSDIQILNLWPGRNGAALHLPAGFDLTPFDGLIIHCTVSYAPLNLFALDTRLARPFEHFDGLKILMKQDEQVLSSRFAAYIAQKKIDLVITCLPPAEQDKVYPRAVVGAEVEFLQAYTGYISPSLRRLARSAPAGRPIDLSYRGSIQPLEFGRLGYEKRGIGLDMAAATAPHADLRVDISSRWEDRINGTAWFDFLSASRVVLGVESGSNLFDFTGEVAAWCRDYEAQHPHADRAGRAFYEAAHAAYLHRFEGNVDYAQISPRHFEAAVCGAAQVLYEGRYSDIFLPHRHFLPLRRDLANLDEVLDFVRDEARVRAMAECAQDEIVANPAYQYERFVERFDEAVARGFARKRAPAAARRPAGSQAPSPSQAPSQAPSPAPDQTPARPLPRALLLMAHEPSVDPRIDWFSEGLAAQCAVCEIGIHAAAGEAPAPLSRERLSERRTRLRVDGRRSYWNFATAPAAAGTGLGVLQQLQLLAELPAGALAEAIGAWDADADDLSRFRWLCRYFVARNSALLAAGRRAGPAAVIVAADLEALPAAVALAEESGAPVVYDAHEYWPHSDPRFRHWEVEFWSDLEERLLGHTALRLTVSPQMAAEMSARYGRAFAYIPNCAALGSEQAVDLEAALAAKAQRDEVVFLFQGNFAQGRGIDKLIAAWDRVDPRARLWLRGPDNPVKAAMVELARSKGLLGRSVFFPEAVAESELVRVAGEADVGLIPYEPSNLNNRYASPNKLSQYMAAGLPILSNEIAFARQVIGENGIGRTLDFADPAALAAAVDAYVADRTLIADQARRARTLFTSQFNWQAMSHNTYNEIKSLVENARREKDGWDLAPSVEPAFPQGWSFPVSPTEEEIDKLTAQIKEMTDLGLIAESEIARLNGIIKDLHAAYGQEIGALNGALDQLSLARVVFRKVKAHAGPLRPVLEWANRYRHRIRSN